MSLSARAHVVYSDKSIQDSCRHVMELNFRDLQRKWDALYATDDLCSTEEIEFELRQRRVPRRTINEFKRTLKPVAAKAFKPGKVETAEESLFLALSVCIGCSVFYRMNDCLTAVPAETGSKSINDTELKEAMHDEFDVLAVHVVKALNYLPYGPEPLTVYRGQSLTNDRNNYKTGTVIVWLGLTSATTNESVARNCLPDRKGLLFQIRCLHARSLSCFIGHEEEGEVLIPPHSYFKIISVKTIKQLSAIEMIQVDIPRSRRCVLWVDDFPVNNKLIIQKAERMEGVSFVQKESTQDAIDFLTNELSSYLLKCGLDEFRIITDVTRNETTSEGFEKIENIEAGFDLIRWLREKRNYLDEIVIFTSLASKDQAENTVKMYKLSNVSVIDSAEDALNFVSFLR